MTYRVVIATPVDGDAITGPVCANGYAMALAQLLRDNGDVRLLPAHITYSKDVVRARNRLAAMVLREMPEATHVLWWDSDVVPHEPYLVGRMLATGRALIGAPYLRKRTPATWTHRPFPGCELPTETNVREGWMPVRSLGFGFTLTSTELLRTTGIDAAKEYIDKRTDGTKHRVRGLFDLAYLTDDEGDTVQESEDYSFCHRSLDTPALYIGKGSVLSHVGEFAYTPGMK
jgi:hypothetical protein